jgi:hypothetical protein
MEAWIMEEKESPNMQLKKMKMSSYKTQVQYAKIHLTPRHDFELNFNFGKDNWTLLSAQNMMWPAGTAVCPLEFWCLKIH